MKFNISREWLDATNGLEERVTVGAGAYAFYPSAEDIPLRPQAVGEEIRIAFGKFISLARRGRHLTIEDLAERADLDVAELVAIEQNDPHFIPEPRSVYQLANYFRVSTEKLMVLAGLTRPKLPGLEMAAMKFAARSASVEELSEKEIQILEGFVSVLSAEREYSKKD